MPVFAVVAYDRQGAPAERREDVRAVHRDYVLSNIEPICFAAAMVDDEGRQNGSLYIFEAESADAVQAWFDVEPFVAGGIYETVAIRKLELTPHWPLPKRA